MTREASNRCAKKVGLLLALFFVMIARDTSRTTTSASALLNFSLADVAEHKRHNRKRPSSGRARTFRCSKGCPKPTLSRDELHRGFARRSCDYCHVEKGRTRRPVTTTGYGKR